MSQIESFFDYISTPYEYLFNSLINTYKYMRGSETDTNTTNTEETVDIDDIITDTDFHKVKDFNILFQVPMLKDAENINKEPLTIIKDGHKLITEEFKELTDALNDKNMTEVKDALFDLIYVIYGLYHRCMLDYKDYKDIFKYTFKGYYKSEYNYMNDYISVMANNFLKLWLDLDYGDLDDISNVSALVDSSNTNIHMYKLKEYIPSSGVRDFKFIHELNPNVHLIKLTNRFKLYDNIKKTYDDLDNFIKDMNLLAKYKTYDEYLNNEEYNTLLKKLGNLNYNVYLMCYILFGEDSKEHFNIVHESNMTKICSTEEQAQETIASYLDKYKNGDTKYDSPDYRKIETHNGTKWVVYNKSTSKILKSVYYRPVEDFNDWCIDIFGKPLDNDLLKSTSVSNVPTSNKSACYSNNKVLYKDDDNVLEDKIKECISDTKKLLNDNINNLKNNLDLIDETNVEIVNTTRQLSDICLEKRNYYLFQELNEETKPKFNDLVNKHNTILDERTKLFDNMKIYLNDRLSLFRENLKLKSKLNILNDAISIIDDENENIEDIKLINVNHNIKIKID